MKNIFNNKKRLKFKDWNFVDRYFKKNKNICWFANFPIVWCFLNSGDKKVFLDNGNLIFFRKKFCRDLRVLFKIPSKSLNNSLKKISPELDLIGINFIQKKPVKKDYCCEEEFVHNNREVVKMVGGEFREIRKNYNYFLKNYSGLVIEDAQKKHLRDLEIFLDEWARDTKGDILIEKIFLRKFLGNEKTPGTIIFDKEKIIGFEFHTISPSDESMGISLFKKNLRGYKGLGEALKIIQSKKLLEKKVLYTNDGNARGSLKHFKEKFMKKGFINKRYSYYLNVKNIKDSKKLLKNFYY